MKTNDEIVQGLEQRQARKREDVIAWHSGAYDQAIKDGDVEEIERLTQSPIEDFVRHA